MVNLHLSEIWTKTGADPGFEVGGSRNWTLVGFPRVSRKNNPKIISFKWSFFNGGHQYHRFCDSISIATESGALFCRGGGQGLLAPAPKSATEKEQRESYLNR